MRKQNSGIVLIEAALIMSVVALIGLFNVNKNEKETSATFKEAYLSCETEVKEISKQYNKLESFLYHIESKKYGK